MKLHYSPTAAAVTTWRGATPLSQADCGTQANRRNNEATLNTSLAHAVTCAKCKALLAA